MTFADKSIYARNFQQVTNRVGEPEMNHINIFKNSQAFSFSVGNKYFEDQ